MRPNPSTAVSVTAADGTRDLTLPWIVSGLGHLLLFLAVIFMPRLMPERSRPPAVIDVTMVSLADTLPAPPRTAEAPPAEVPAEAQPAAAPQAPPPKPAAVSIAPRDAAPEPSPPPETEAPPFKQSLKRQTYRPEDAVQEAIEKLEEVVETARPAAVSEAIERLREAAGTNPAIERLKREAARSGPPAGVAGSGRRAMELEDIYRLEIAYLVNKNWAFSDSLAGAGGDVYAEVAFTVLPDGRIRDIWFDRRSGNGYLDESARRAILKSDPLPPHPKGVSRPFVTVGLRFTPQGVMR